MGENELVAKPKSWRFSVDTLSKEGRTENEEEEEEEKCHFLSAKNLFQAPIAGTSQGEEKNFGKNLKKRGLVLSNNAELLGKPFTETHDAWVTIDEFSFLLSFC